jgi:hypothetical protein
MKSRIWIVLAVVLCASAIAVRSFVKARNTRSAHPCLNNLRLIEGAKGYWAYTNHVTKLDAQVDVDDILPYIKGHRIPNCNWTGTNTYIIETLGKQPKCPVHGTITEFRKPWDETIHDWWHGL